MNIIKETLNQPKHLINANVKHWRLESTALRLTGDPIWNDRPDRHELNQR